MARTFYGIEYAYGLGVSNNGTRADYVYTFSSVAARDRWIEDGPADMNAAGFRDAVSAQYPLVRKAQRAANLGLEWPQAV